MTINRWLCLQFAFLALFIFGLVGSTPGPHKLVPPDEQLKCVLIVFALFAVWMPASCWMFSRQEECEKAEGV